MTPAPRILERELVTLLAYLETGSHKAAAHQLGITESTSRQRRVASPDGFGPPTPTALDWYAEAV